ncbi:MAG: rRNA adenine N-6-methyltransferase family protein [Candidatus Woesearchaeota archaeon]
MKKLILIYNSEKKYLIKDLSKDFHCEFGLIKSEKLMKSKTGDVLKTNTDKELFVIEADFIDVYNKIKRGAQIIPRKDIGLIITEIGLNKDSVIIECGSGSGALGGFLSKICKKVYSYEIREDFYKIVKSNIELLELDNYILKLKDGKTGFEEKDVDSIILDLPDPWVFIEIAKESLKTGGFLVSYSPTIPQVMDFVEKINSDDSFIYLKTSEIIEREWEINKRKVRPFSKGIGHSGFLSFARKVKN